MRTTTRFVPECSPLVVALLIVAGSFMAAAGIPSAQARTRVHVRQQLAPGRTALPAGTSTDCVSDAAQLPARWRRGYYVPFVRNGPPPGNPNQTGYLFDHRVSGPIAQGSWSTVVYGPRLGSQHPIPSFQWVEIQGAFCGGVFWERQWQYWQQAPAVASQTIRQYYAEINLRRYHAAYRNLAAGGRAPFPAFSRGYQRTTHVTLQRLAIPAYTIHRSGAEYTCAGIQFQAHERSGSVVEYGGWYLVQVKSQSDGYLVLSGSVILRNGSLTVPTRGECANHVP